MFNEILVENAKINNYYWDGKLPKLIKKIICKKRRGRLRRKLKYFTDTDNFFYTSANIYEILSYASIQPPLSFNKIKEYDLVINTIDEPDNPVFLASLSWIERDIKNLILFGYDFHIVSKPNRLEISVNACDTRNNKDNNKKLINITGEEEGLYVILKSDKYDEHITSLLHGLNAMLGEIVYEFIEDQFARSERIYNGK